MTRMRAVPLVKPAVAGERPAVGEGEARPSPSPTLPYDLGSARALALVMLLGLVFFAGVIAAVVAGVIA